MGHVALEANATLTSQVGGENLSDRDTDNRTGHSQLRPDSGHLKARHHRYDVPLELKQRVMAAGTEETERNDWMIQLSTAFQELGVDETDEY